MSAERLLTVYDRIDRPVEAKYLTDFDGNNVINPRTGQAYIVPLNYSLDDSIYVGRSVYTSASPYAEAQMLSFRPNGSQDLQRSYNGIAGRGYDGFVEEFRDIASFHYGLSGRLGGYTPEALLALGGIANVIFNSQGNLSGLNFNHPRNPQNILAGSNYYDSGLRGQDTNWGYGDRIRIVEIAFGVTGTGYEL